MSLFVMQPMTKAPSIPETKIEQAEHLLQHLRQQVDSAQNDEPRSIRKRRKQLIDILSDDRLQQRQESDRIIHETEEEIKRSTQKLETLEHHLSSTIEKLTGGGTDCSTPEAALQWKQSEVMRLEEIYGKNQQQLAGLATQLDDHGTQLNQVQLELEEATRELEVLVLEDQKLSKADRTAEIEAELKDLRARLTSHRRKAAKLCKITYKKEFTITQGVEKLETELDQIYRKIEMIGGSLESFSDEYGSTENEANDASDSTDEFGSIIKQVKSALNQKLETLKAVKKLRETVAHLYRLEKTAQLDLDGEKARLKKQKARADLIRQQKARQEERHQNLLSIQEKISEIEATIEALRSSQQEIDHHIGFLNEQSKSMRSIQAEIDACRTHIAQQKAKLRAVIPSASIWYDSILFRITKVRKKISLGNPLLVLLLPFASHSRYTLGLTIRKELIKTERSLQQLGFLNESYIHSIDIFNRRDRRGRQLCLDILNC